MYTEFIRSTFGAIVGTALPLFFIWCKDSNKDKQVQTNLKRICNDIKESIEQDLVIAQEDIQKSQSMNNSAQLGRILNIYFKIQNYKYIFDQCNDNYLKVWFNNHFKNTPSPSTPQGSLTQDPNGTALMLHFKKHFLSQ